MSHCINPEAVAVNGRAPTFEVCKRCPFKNRPFGNQPQPIPTVNQAAKAGRAILTNAKVSQETMEQRVLICSTCKFVGKSADSMWCTLCNCPLSMDERKIFNLAAHVENLPLYGCKHPERKNGKGWPQ